MVPMILPIYLRYRAFTITYMFTITVVPTERPCVELRELSLEQTGKAGLCPSAVLSTKINRPREDYVQKGSHVSPVTALVLLSYHPA